MSRRANTCIAAKHRRYAPVTWLSAPALVPRFVAETHVSNATAAIMMVDWLRA